MYGLPYTGHSFATHLVVVAIGQIRNFYSFMKLGILKESAIDELEVK